MPASHWWKEFYRAERASLGATAFEQIVKDAPLISLPTKGALIFPHTRLTHSGNLIAAVAKGVVESGCDTVLAIGVLHGGNRDDLSLRGIHGPGMPHDKGMWKDEFSLDNFSALLRIASELAGKPMPNIIARYPYLTGENPESLAGFAELRTLVDDGAALVATGDLVHHGAGYGTPKEEQLPRTDPSTLAIARQWIEEQLKFLSQGDYAGFLEKAKSVRSDFRDAGPVVATLVPNAKYTIDQLTLIDYANVLHAEDPTWAAAAVVKMGD
jgi:predicted class III extradiol MEMO1 family dioxygenase